jgi:hypothetical protein
MNSGVEWIKEAQLLSLVNLAMKFMFLKKARNFLTSLLTITSRKMNLLLGISNPKKYISVRKSKNSCEER